MKLIFFITVLAIAINVPAKQDITINPGQVKFKCKKSHLFHDFNRKAPPVNVLLCSFNHKSKASHGLNILELTKDTAGQILNEITHACKSQNMEFQRYVKNFTSGGIENYKILHKTELLNGRHSLTIKMSGEFYCTPDQLSLYIKKLNP